MNETKNRWNSAHRPSEEHFLPPSAPNQVPHTPELKGSPRVSRDNSSHNSCELNAIVGEGTHFEGNLSFSGQIRIDGQVEGEIRGGQLLIIGEGSSVTGEIHAAQVIILGGTVEANIYATDSIEIYLPAVVAGDLHAPQIYMDRGIEFQGTCDMTGNSPG